MFVLKLLLLLVPLVRGDRHDVHEMMYQTLNGAAGCFRRMNGTHQFGCSSPRKGSLGVIQMVETETELKFLLESAAAGPYMVVLSPRMIGINVINRLKSVPGKVSGIVFTDRHQGNLEFPESYSPDDSCPNSAESSCDVNNPWNPYGNRYLLTDWEVPLFLVNNHSNYDTIVNCYKTFNLPLDESQLSKPLCSLHMKSHMFAAVNSDVCTRRINYHFVNSVKYCDPIGNENVVFPMISNDEIKSTKKKFIVVAAKLDTATLFDGIAPGAMSSVTGIVTLMTTATILHDIMPKIKDSKQPIKKGLIFMLFNGETFDYIGSNRVLYDMEKNQFLSKTNPITLDSIDMFIDISQIGSVSPAQGKSDDTSYIHTTNKDSLLFAKDLIDIGSTFNITFTRSSVKELPPTSFSTFHKAASKMSGLVLTNYDGKFKTKYYEGFYDTGESLGYSYLNGSVPEKNTLQYNIAGVALTLAVTLTKAINNYNITNDLHITNIEHYAKKVDELLYCYLQSRKCSLLESVYPIFATESKFPDVMPLYVGVQHTVNHMTKATGLLMSYLASPQVNIAKDKCITEDADEDYLLIWLNGENGNGVCVNTSMKFTPAVSPAFIIENYDWASGQYPTWTESVWDDNSLGIFLKPSKTDEIIILVVGLLTSFTTFVAIYFIKKKSDDIFMSQFPTSC